MTHCVFAIPGDLATPTGGYVYARKIIPLLAESLGIEICRLPAGFPLASEAELHQAAASLAAFNAPGTVFSSTGLLMAQCPCRRLRL
jgi:hypothetical protein